MISIIIIFGIIFYIIDVLTMKGNYMSCNNMLVTHITLLVHHIINIFAQFGWLSNNKYVLYTYLTAPLIVLLHWKTNDNKCIMTEYVNDQCGIKTGTYFRDLWFLLGIKKLKNYDTIHKIYLIIVWIIAVVKVYLLHRSSASH
jgi:hypothetical protein